jgi:hypothetical protein
MRQTLSDGIWVLALAGAFAPLLPARTPGWTVLGIQDTGITEAIETPPAVSANGDIYTAAFEGTPQGPCPVPTLTLGGLSNFSSCVTKTSASGQMLFSVQLGGANVNALVLDGQGNVYMTGSTGTVGAPAFAPTAGAYETSPPNDFGNFVCALSHAGGHPLFCTFADVYVASTGFTVDSQGNSYLPALKAPGCETTETGPFGPL